MFSMDTAKNMNQRDSAYSLLQRTAVTMPEGDFSSQDCSEETSQLLTDILA